MLERTHSVPEGWGLCPQSIPIYPICMLLAFAAAFAVYRYNAKKSGQSSEHLLPIALAAFFGGLIGAKLPVILLNLRYGFSLEALLTGRTIVGGLVGGTLGVLFIKRKLGIRGRYGNLLAAPIALGMAIGRLGCLLNGCCYGKPFACGVDFGDGIARHPTQLYEGLFCLTAFFLIQRARNTAPPGTLLSRFFMAYFAFRFLEEFIRPHPVQFGLTTYQWICIAGILILFAKSQLMKPKEDTP
ncbi:prolipoprotein diacylglyceryl transferase [Pontiellaceae bacterium B1224]|nr:prolipoprotein diacylglyceryl transferase [Pontiellaceae bacterium B1224]